MDTAGEGEGATNQESSIAIYALPCIEQIASGKLLQNTGSSAQCSDNLEGGMEGDEREVQEGGGHINTQVADSHCCTAETHTTL